MIKQEWVCLQEVNIVAPGSRWLIHSSGGCARTASRSFLREPGRRASIFLPRCRTTVPREPRNAVNINFEICWALGTSVLRRLVTRTRRATPLPHGMQFSLILSAPAIIRNLPANLGIFPSEARGGCSLLHRDAARLRARCSSAARRCTAELARQCKFELPVAGIVASERSRIYLSEVIACRGEPADCIPVTYSRNFPRGETEIFQGSQFECLFNFRAIRAAKNTRFIEGRHGRVSDM